MKTEEVLSLVMTEIIRAEEKHPDWPADPVRAAAVVAEESGECYGSSRQSGRNPQ